MWEEFTNIGTTLENMIVIKDDDMSSIQKYTGEKYKIIKYLHVFW